VQAWHVAPGADASQDSAQTGVQVVRESGGRRGGSSRKGPDDEPGARGQVSEAVTDQVAQPARDAVANNRAAHGTAHHEPGARG
jgi:hypothetical protein